MAEIGDDSVIPCILYISKTQGITGQLAITNYRTIISPSNPSYCFDNYIKAEYYDIPHLLVYKLTSAKSKGIFNVKLYTKDGRHIKIGFDKSIQPDCSTTG